MRRRFRIIYEPDTTKPWIVQYDAYRSHTWTDAQRFAHPDEAVQYLEDVNVRDQALDEAER